MTVIDDSIPTGRGLLDRLVDDAARRLLKLPTGTVDYTITRDLRIPTRDGLELAADLYRPLDDPIGTVLVRGPYGRGLTMTLTTARLCASHGYQVLFVSSRGTFGSGGIFQPARTEADDGQDVLFWMYKQDWYTGSFATVGASYLGFTQWALMSDTPVQPAAAVVVMAPHDFSRHHWGTGAFNLDMLAWSEMIAHQEDPGARNPLRRLRTARAMRPVLDGLPLADVAEKHFGGAAPWYRDIVTHPDLSDPYWAPLQQRAALEKVETPVLLIGGWQDLFLEQTVRQYTRLQERDVDVALTIGPWTHLEMATKAAGLIATQTLEWLDEHLAEREDRTTRKAAVQVYVTGADEWREDLETWPPDTEDFELFLGPGRALVEQPSLQPTSPLSFTFDPAAPTPTVGGPLMRGGGYRDDGKLVARNDVLTFTGDLLTKSVQVFGTPVVDLDHSTDNPHADLFVRLSDVDGQGRSRSITEGYVRLDPEREEGPVIVRMRPTAHRFEPGHRIRLIVAGGSHPQFARNLGTGENPGTGSELRPSTHTVQYDAQHPSCLVLPVVS
ncbi:CocE/NonD family hydrolase [Nocardia sp. BMG111209]|uniref:CocE/NonD family hydrolase n=1 Tax=Nocardia sp. BMG111209 TaxID=1160137 RepID=UPI00037E972B|nr:CocE/NonD family hydrolase [Nocardia sp. BMG111209]